jgi:predicted O-methyltransferase YrrM
MLGQLSSHTDDVLADYDRRYVRYVSRPKGTSVMISLARMTPTEFADAVVSSENRDFTIRTMKMLSPDPVWSDHITSQIDAGNVETRSVIAFLARELKPQTYLEVGVRRGFSMGMVISRALKVDVFGFDLWLQNYAGIANPGIDFVRNEMERLGHKGRLQLITGNSHETLPSFFRKEAAPPDLAASHEGRDVPDRPEVFDLITIDGDHSLTGAYQDLVDTMPHCAIGGAIVFDDIAPDLAIIGEEAIRTELGADPHGWRDLLGVWRAIQSRFTNFAYFELCNCSPGVGIAIRTT